MRERMSSVDIDTVMPQDLINAKPAAAAVRLEQLSTQPPPTSPTNTKTPPVSGKQNPKISKLT